jgi:hypothetical protein
MYIAEKKTHRGLLSLPKNDEGDIAGIFTADVAVEIACKHLSRQLSGRIAKSCW